MRYKPGESKVVGTERLEAINHKYKSGATLENLEIEEVLAAALWAMGEIEHIFAQEPGLYPEITGVED